MAKITAATKTKTASGKAKTAAPAGKKPMTKTGTGGLDELSSLAVAGKNLEDAERAKTGSQSSFITLVKANGQVLDKNNPAYMKGVKPLDYVIASKKLVVSDKRQCIDATIVGMFKIYAEVAKDDRESEMPKTVRFWMPEDAAQYPVTPGGIFERGLPGGNVLIPCHWVFLYLHDHPEIEDGMIAFRSKGNAIYSQLEKLVKVESSVCTELRFSISHQDIYNEKYKKTDYYPKFEITGHNYKLTEDGKVVRTKDSDVDTATLKEILTRAKKIYEDYSAMKMVSRREALPAPNSRPALPAGKGGYESDDGDENLTF